MRKASIVLVTLLLCAPVFAQDPVAPAAPAAAVTAAPAPVPADAPVDVPAAPVVDKDGVPITPPDVSAVAANPGDTVGQAIDAFAQKEWGIAIGFVLMLLVWGVTLFWKSIPSAYLPWLSVGLSVVGTVAVELSVGRSWWRAILSALTTGTSASGLYSLFGKKILKKRKKTAKKEEAKPEEKKDAPK